MVNVDYKENCWISHAVFICMKPCFQLGHIHSANESVGSSRRAQRLPPPLSCCQRTPYSVLTVSSGHVTWIWIHVLACVSDLRAGLWTKEKKSLCISFPPQQLNKEVTSRTEPGTGLSRATSCLSDIRFMPWQLRVQIFVARNQWQGMFEQSINTRGNRMKRASPNVRSVRLAFLLCCRQRGRGVLAKNLLFGYVNNVKVTEWLVASEE